MTFSVTFGIVLGTTGGVCKADKRNLVYIDNPCEIIIIIIISSSISEIKIMPVS